MAAGRERSNGKRRRRAAILTVVTLVLGLVGMGLQVPSQAALGQTDFDVLDGNEVVNAPEVDWLTPGLAVDSRTDTPSGQTDSSLSGEEDDTTPTYTEGNIQPNKSDLTRIRMSTETKAGKDFLYLAWDRVPDPSGNVSIDFELNAQAQPALPAEGQDWALVRTEDDILLTFELVGGGTVPQISLRYWETDAASTCDSNPSVPCWGPPTILTATTTPAAEGSVNPGIDITFGEMAIDLGLAGIFTPGECTSFASVYAKSRSSGSGFNSQISDLVAPLTKTVSNCGSITVTKTVTGPTAAGDQTSFQMTVDCGAVDLNGATAGTDAVFSLASGGSQTVTDIPVGSTCSVTETAPTPAGGWSTTYQVDNGSATSGTSATGLVVPLAGKTVAFTNTRLTGGLSVTKTVVGGAGGESFAFTASCTGYTLAAGDAAFNLTGGATKSITGIPIGTSCTVTETDPGSNWSTTRSVNGGAATASRTATVTTDANGESVAFTNTRNTGALTVTKATSGGTGTFDFTVSCAGHTLAAGDAAFQLSGGGTKTISGVPTGTSCTVTETDPGSDWSTTYAVDGGAATAGRSTSSVVDGDGTTVAFTNTRNTGSLVVSKSVVGPTNASDPTSFAFSVSCAGVTLAAGDASFTLASGASKTISGIPTGTSCTVTETDPGPGWTTTRSVDAAVATSSRSATSTVDADGTSVAFTNTRLTGSLTVTKTTSGDTGTFAFTVSCTGFTLDAGDASFSLSGGGTRTIDDIPTGTSCTVTETDPGTRWSTSYQVDAAAATAGRTAGSTVDADGTTVAFTNVRNTGSLTITKTTTGGNGTFSFTVDCDGTAFDQTLTVTTTAGSGTSTTITGIPTETDCTVTETVPAGWVATSGASKTITIDGAETAAFANRLLASGIDVTKTPSATTVHAGDAVTYTYVVTNPGENPLGSVKVVDDKCAAVTFVGGDTDGDTILDLTETWTFRCTSTLTATTTNVATATGVDPRDQTVTDTATATVTVIRPVIAIDKSASATSVDPGTTVVYTYTVTNPGDVPLGAVAVADDKCSPVTFVGGDTNGDGLLQVTETWTFRCSQVQTGAADTLTNVGTARGTDPLGAVVTSNDTVTVAVVAPQVLAQPVAVAPATLPRTGIDVRGWLQVGGSLVLLGLALLLTSRRRRTA